MKKILITQIISEHQDYHEVRESIDTQWGPFLSSVGVIPIPISYNYPLIDYLNNFDIGGILLTGGNTLSYISNCKNSEIRDKFESNLIYESLLRNIPIIGVCRGMQILAKFFNLNINPVEDHVGVKHQINFADNTKYFKEYTTMKSVNSFHRYAVSNTNSDIYVTARSNDGSIESFEHINQKIVGIMWHPERNDIEDIEDINLFKNVWS